MPNVIDANGLQVATRAELIANYTAAMQAIYGADINLDQDSPDGQMMNIQIQSALDMEDLLVQIYNMFDPDNAIGVVLDQRVAINGIQRQAGTHTITPITLVINQSCNLYGIDQDIQPVYTVADNAGTRYVLQTTQLGVTVGTHVYNFQALLPGATLTTPNTINVPVTVVLGVQSINNPTTYTTLGINEETDAVLKVRRQKSVSLASQGYLAGLLAALKNTTGVTSAFVYENTTGSTNSDGVPGHSIWVIVGGSPAPADIAQDIYTKRNAGCGMKGSQSYTITQVDGTPFVVSWDYVLTRNLFVKFNVASINGITPPNVQTIRANLPTVYTPAVFEEVNINGLATAVQKIDPNALVTNAGFSSGELQIINLSAVPLSGTATVSYAGNTSAAINWNDSIATIQTKVQAVPGLSAALVTGSMASQILNFNLSGVGGPAGLITMASSLIAAGPADVIPTYDEGYTPTLLPGSKQFEFILSTPNTIITPMQLKPFTASIAASATLQMAAYGGYGAYVYAVQSGTGTINPVTGLYTAPGGSTVDTIQVTDAMGNTATATITVT
jgi:hypothetical protein